MKFEFTRLSRTGVALSAAAALCMTALPAQENGNAGGFEIDDFGTLHAGDGDLSGIEVGSDWAGGVLTMDGSPVTGEIAIRWTDMNWGPEGDGFDCTTFGPGSAKNDDHIGEGQDPWRWSAGAGGPKKNDITNIYVHTRVSSPEEARWLILAAETRSVNGNSSIDFEFSQAGIVQTGTTSGELVGLGLDNGRTIDDLMVSVEFLNGGVFPSAVTRSWNGDRFATVDHGDNVFVSVNLEDISHPASGEWYHYTADGATTETISALQLVEVAINLTALGFDLDVCDSDSTAMVRTRSSQSIHSALKDFALVSFPLHPLPDMEIEGPTVVTTNEQVIYNAATVAATPLPGTSEVNAFLLGTGDRLLTMDRNLDGAISAADIVTALSASPPDYPTNGCIATPEIDYMWLIDGSGEITSAADGVSVEVTAGPLSGESYTLTLITSAGFCDKETSLTATITSAEEQ